MHSNSVLNGGIVLVVDDEPIVRKTAKLMLQKLGCEVLEAGNGAEALSMFASRPADLVLLDVSMPVLSGEAALREILRINPHVPVIVSSGYNEQFALERFSSLGVSTFLQKPYTWSRLLDAVNQVMTRPLANAAGPASASPAL